jgi:hypothetical protein
MGARQAIIAILSVPAVFLVCFALLGTANVVLRMILDPFVVDKMRLVARWGLFRTTVRLFEHEARTGQTEHAYFIGGMLARSLLGSAAITMALVVALTPTELPAWVVWACVVIGFSTFHVGLARDARTFARGSVDFFAEATTKRFPRYDVPRASIVGSVLAVMLYRRWNSTVFHAFGLSLLFAVTRLVVVDGSAGLAAALLVGGPAVTFPLGVMAGRFIDELWTGAAAQDAIQRRLRSRRRPGAWVRPTRLVFDRFADERRELTHITDLLVRTADRLDSGVASHPNAVLLRGCAARVQAHLSSLTSLTARAPQSLDTILAEASILFIGPKQPDFYAGLNRLTDAFDADGAPAPQFTEPARKGLWSLVRRASDAAETSHKLVVSSLGVASIVVLTILILTGQLSGTALLKP